MKLADINIRHFKRIQISNGDDIGRFKNREKKLINTHKELGSPCFVFKHIFTKAVNKGPITYPHKHHNVTMEACLPTF